MSLKEEFKDREYRLAYADSFANTVIATQIRLLRGDKTQAEFADKVGMKQSRISAMEDENYSAWSTNTLKQIAGENDVVFLGRFVSYGELLDWSRRFSEEALAVAPFSNDPAFAREDYEQMAAALETNNSPSLTDRQFELINTAEAGQSDGLIDRLWNNLQSHSGGGSELQPANYERSGASASWQSDMALAVGE
jgi:hypothetical protein